VEERTADLKAVQEELVRQERLATLGKLTATVSHELRNPLGTISSSLYLVNERLRDKDNGIQRALERAKSSVSRCDNIIEEVQSLDRLRSLSVAGVLN